MEVGRKGKNLMDITVGKSKRKQEKNGLERKASGLKKSD